MINEETGQTDENKETCENKETVKNIFPDLIEFRVLVCFSSVS